jgi:hypothetical protein
LTARVATGDDHLVQHRFLWIALAGAVMFVLGGVAYAVVAPSLRQHARQADPPAVAAMLNAYEERSHQ